jgi:uncharacterized repeat protein (TIGR01451 family)
MRPICMVSRSLRFLFCVVAVTVCPCLAFAQTFQVNVSAPASATVGNNITYTITVNNTSGILLPTVQVTSVFPTSLQFVSANPTPASTSAGMASFLMSQLNVGQSGQLSLTLRPTQAGTVTNVVTAISGQLTPAIDSAVTTVTGQQQGRSDLSVSITRPTGMIFVNDWVEYTINLSRQGDPVSGVFVTNVIPSGAILQGYFPSNGASVDGSRLVFNLGTFSLQSTQLHVTIQPTTVNVFQLLAQVRGGTDTNTANNTATNSLAVTNVPVLGQLEATRASDQFFNPQNALIEQLITVTNVSMTNLPSARVILSNFPYRVVNAVGTNDGNPFVVHAGPLTNRQSVELLLEYAIPDRTPKDDPELIAYAAGTVDLTPPSGGTNVAITNIHFLSASGAALTTNRLLVEFPATRSNRYQIVYSSNMSFSPAFKAMPPIVAQANRVQWIDYGPPKTLSRPGFVSITPMQMLVTNMETNIVITNMMTNMVVTNIVTTNIVFTTNASMRFYRALQLP